MKTKIETALRSVDAYLDVLGRTVSGVERQEIDSLVVCLVEVVPSADMQAVGFDIVDLVLSQ